jgi:hypothetical protein
MPQHYRFASGRRALHLRSDDARKSRWYFGTLKWIVISIALIFIATPCDLLTMRSYDHGSCSRL